MRRVRAKVCCLALACGTTLMGCGGGHPSPAAGQLRGMPDGCASFYGSEGARASISNTSGLFPAAFTIELWARFDHIPTPDFNQIDAAIPPPQRIFEAESSTNDTGFYIELDHDTLVPYISCGFRQGTDWWRVQANATGSEGVWQHIACQVAPDAIAVWIQGAPVTAIARPATFATYQHDGSPALLGAANAVSPSVVDSNGFVGAVDEVRVSSGSLYTVALGTGNQPAQLASFAPYQRAPLLDSTLALYHFDECSGVASADSGLDGRGLSLDDGVTWLSPEGAP